MLAEDTEQVPTHQIAELVDEDPVPLGHGLRLAVAVMVKGVHGDAARRQRAEICVLLNRSSTAIEECAYESRM